MDVTVQEQIRTNAELVIKQLGQISDIENFGYNLESVAWVDGFIERQRNRPDFSQDSIDRLVQNLGSFIGECIIACYGGAWQHEEGTWAVAFNQNNFVFPFNKVRKQFVSGSEDSIRSFFEMIPILYAQYL
ncbi:MAG: hypothetical protein ACAF41_22525 [Leptolyngbya sp. BL-A-14]